MHACVLSHFSLVQLFAGLRTVVRQTPLSIGFSSQEYRGSSWLEINPHHLRLLHCRQILHPWATGEALAICKDAVNPLPEDGSCRRRSQWKTLNQAFSLCIQSPSYALTQPHGSNTEARQHSGLCWFPEASRNPHPEVETGAGFKCLAGSCSRRLNPGALQSPPWVACSVLPRVEVTIPHCKDQSNKKNMYSHMHKILHSFRYSYTCNFWPGKSLQEKTSKRSIPHGKHGAGSLPRAIPGEFVTLGGQGGAVFTAVR